MRLIRQQIPIVGHQDHWWQPLAALVLVATIPPAALAADVPAPRKPNVLVIVADAIFSIAFNRLGI